MKRISILLSSLLFVLSIRAQDSTFTPDDAVINLGIGIGSTYYSGSGYSGLIPPLSISYEKGIKNVFDKGTIGVGAYAGYTSSEWKYSDSYGSYKWKYSNILIGARGALHYPLIDELDTYAGLMLGYDIASSSYSSTGMYEDQTVAGDSYGGLIWSFYLGGRYWFSDKMAGMLELGYGISYLNIGIAFKL
jgi:hypothetical protein